MICTRLRELKESKNLTNQALSNLSNVPIGTVNRIMSHQTDNPGIDTVIALASALGTTVDGLLYGKERATSSEKEIARVISTYEKIISEKDALLADKDIRIEDKDKALRYHVKWVRFLCGVSLALFAFIIIWLVIDVLSPHIGWLH